MKVIIIGGGQVGSYLASLLLSRQHEVRVIEHREKVFKKLENELPHEAGWPAGDREAPSSARRQAS